MSSQTFSYTNESRFPISFQSDNNYFNKQTLVSDNSLNSDGIQKFSYRVKIYTDEGGRIVAKCDNLQGVVTDGENEEEVLKNVKEAIDAVLEANNIHEEYNILIYK